MTSEAQGLALLSQARQALRDGLEGEALALARQAAGSFPDSLVVRITLGFALSASGLHDDAERVFEEARAARPGRRAGVLRPARRARPRTLAAGRTRNPPGA